MPDGLIDLRGRTAVVTGGASGIGAAVKMRLDAEGVRAVSWDVAGDCDIRCDVSDERSVAEAWEATVELAGVPTILAAVAGIIRPGRLLDTSVDDWDATFAVNVRGIFLCMRAVAKGIIKAGLDGSIAMISSLNSVLSDPGVGAYSASKAAVAHLARVAAVEFGPHGIRVNAIGPGPTATPMNAANLATPSWAPDVVAATPLGLMGTPELVADAVVGTMRMGWVTGQAFLADGGAALVSARGARRLAAAEALQSRGNQQAGISNE